MIGGFLKIQGDQTLFQSFLQDWIAGFGQIPRQPVCVSRAGNDQGQNNGKPYDSVYLFHNCHIVTHINNKIK
jgi:hypothetical protein